MVLKPHSSRHGNVVLVPFMAAAAASGCSQMQPLPYSQAQAELAPPQRSQEHLTLGIERTSGKPPRISAKVIDIMPGLNEYSGYCWLFYREGMLLRPDAEGEAPRFMGAVSGGAVVRVKPTSAGGAWEEVKGPDGKPDVLYRVLGGKRPVPDALFWKHSPEVCRFTEEGRITAYLGGQDLQVTAVPLPK